MNAAIVILIATRIQTVAAVKTVVAVIEKSQQIVIPV